MGIVDGAAFCYVVTNEAKMAAKAIKEKQYSQDKQWIRSQVNLKCTSLTVIGKEFSDFGTF